VGARRPHESVCHSKGEYVRDDVHTNGIESLRSMLKRAYKGIFHNLGLKHLDRSVRGFATKHNWRELDTIDIMGAMASGGVVKGLRYRELIADKGLPNGTHNRWNHQVVR